jgi:hypothetical protein
MGSIDHALTAAADLLQQFVIAQFSRRRRQTLAPGGLAYWFAHVTGVIDPGYGFFVE